MTGLEYWPIVQSLVQWLVIPAIVIIWNISKRQTQQEKEILRILTIIEERDKRRTEDRDSNMEVFQALRASIEKLHDKIDHIAEGRK